MIERWYMQYKYIYLKMLILNVQTIYRSIGTNGTDLTFC